MSFFGFTIGYTFAKIFIYEQKNKKSSQRGIRYSPKNPVNNKNDSAYFFLVYMHFYFFLSHIAQKQLF